MCGITGLFDRSGAPADAALLARMTHALAHRGPDGDGLFVDGELGLGHRRLSIIDVEGGAQPLGNEDGNLQVVFNGEIYNHVELREELLAHGHVFRTRSDTEVIVHAWEQWGSACLDRFNGMFAFALFDRRSRTLVLARDHLGIKPLYYTVLGEQLLFASEIKALLCHPAMRREVDRVSLAQLFTYRYVPSPRTLLSGVFKLPPGHWMRVTAREVSVQRHWNSLPQPRAATAETALIDEYQALLDDTLTLQLRSDVPLGLFLSSGVDSGALLAMMARRSSRPVQTFTIDFENGQATNEGDDAALIAARHGAVHHRQRVDAGDYARYFERYMGDLEEPVGHEAAPAFYFLSRLAGEQVKVCLTGQGADEPWAGYGRYLGVKLSTIYSRLPEVMTRAVASLVTRVPLPSERLRRGVISLGERDLLLRFVKIYSFFSADMKHQLYRDALRSDLLAAPLATADPIRPLQQEVAHLDALSQILYIDTRTNLPDDLLMVGDKTSMANALELRVPFLDRRLVAFIESLPPEMKLRGLTGKYLHKKAMLGWLPASEVYRAKKGFANPIAGWLRGPMRALVDDCLLSGHSSIAGWFNQDFIRKLVLADREGRGPYTRQIFLLLSLELWQRRFLHGGSL
jgi:asparagine synthase (glutamine-hydrolysing)